MKVLIVEPGKNPRTAEIENTLSAKQAIVPKTGNGFIFSVNIDTKRRKSLSIRKEAKAIDLFH